MPAQRMEVGYAAHRCWAVPFVLMATACGGSPAAPTPPPAGGSSNSTIEAAVSQAYMREFGLNITRPAIYNDDRSVNCNGEGHLTTTAYFRSGAKTATLQFMYMTRDASTVTRKDAPRTVVVPAGHFRALVVVAQHPQTVGADALALLSAGQAQINEDHAAFARGKGFGQAIVSFESTNVAIDPGQITNMRARDPVLLAVAGQGHVTTGYDFIMMLNIDPSLSEGGFARLSESFVYVGNYSNWKTILTSSNWASIARTAYHHEVAHHWGWPGTHDWSSSCGGTNLGFGQLITAPVLFGWEDVDGDGVPEILDSTPYGEPRSSFARQS